MYFHQLIAMQSKKHCKLMEYNIKCNNFPRITQVCFHKIILIYDDPIYLKLDPVMLFTLVVTSVNNMTVIPIFEFDLFNVKTECLNPLTPLAFSQ